MISAAVEDSPGFRPARLLSLMQQAIRRCDLNLEGSVVLTEAASGAYVVTPIIAAMSGATRVYGFTRSTRYGTVQQVTDLTMSLARQAGVADRIEIVTTKSREVFNSADIVTNAAHLRPLDSTSIGWMKSTAVIPLMYEAWELRASDVDLSACDRHGIPISGTNEQHAKIEVFSYLGMMAVKLLLDAGIPVYGCRVLILCDNAFASYITHGLSMAGANVTCRLSLEDVREEGDFDVILVALTPRGGFALGSPEAAVIAERWRTALVSQYWGDLDRESLLRHDVAVWPEEAPARGHMAVLPSDIGPDPVVRLQTGGLKVGEIMWRTRREGGGQAEAADAAVRSGFGQHVVASGFWSAGEA